MNKISGIIPDKKRGQSFKSKMSTMADSNKGLFGLTDRNYSKPTINDSSLKLPQISVKADRSSPRIFEQRKASLMTIFQLNTMGNSTNKHSRNAISYNYGTQNYSQVKLKNDVN